nr:MAG TPA: hypothetical protein [Caudoviricetes sp.]
MRHGKRFYHIRCFRYGRWSFFGCDHGVYPGQSRWR